jgi:hypothetical protein
MTAPHVQQPSDRKMPLDQIEQPCCRATTTRLLVKVPFVFGGRIPSPHQLRRRKLSGLNGPTPPTYVQVAVDADLMTGRSEFRGDRPLLEPRIAKFGRVAT